MMDDQDDALIYFKYDVKNAHFHCMNLDQFLHSSAPKLGGGDAVDEIAYVTRSLITSSREPSHDEHKVRQPSR